MKRVIRRYFEKGMATLLVLVLLLGVCQSTISTAYASASETSPAVPDEMTERQEVSVAESERPVAGVGVVNIEESETVLVAETEREVPKHRTPQPKAEEGIFTALTAPAVPGYYEESGTAGVYRYKTSDEHTYYRVYGNVDDENEGFYAANADGTLILPAVVLDQGEESNNAYNAALQADIKDNLVDNEAYISGFEVSSISDGTAPWDGNDLPGNDSNTDNRMVRSFDSVYYTMHYVNKLQNQATTSYFKNGYIEIRFELPCTLAEAKFDTEAMTWLIDPIQEEVDGKVVLTGRRYITAGSASAAIPGEGELSAVVNVLGMKNGDQLVPTFHVWMQGNPEHQEKSVSGAPVTVSAAPSYNIQLKQSTQLDWKGSFDFSTGDTDAGNKEQGTVNGRLYGYGVTLQLMNPVANKGLKGIELPMGQITFDLHVKVEKGTQEVTGTGAGQLMPLLWDYKPNNQEDLTGVQGRNMYWGESLLSKSAWQTAPVNAGGTGSGCLEGGTWSAVQTGSSISVTVAAYQFLTTENTYHWPTSNIGVVATANTYGVEKGIGCFSAGYFQILCPDPATVGAEENDNYHLTVWEDNMRAESVTGQVAENVDQKNKTDDIVTTQYRLAPVGKYTKYNFTTRATQWSTPYNTNLSSASANQSGDAWSAPGVTIELWGSISNDATNDLAARPFAFNILQKFDDEAFQPLPTASGTLSSSSFEGNPATMKYRLLYAAKPGGVSWNSDLEMSLAEEADLEYFPTMAALKAQYPSGVCVAVLIEGREGQLIGVNHIGFNVNVLPGAETGKVYQTTNTVSIWTQAVGSTMTQADSRLSEEAAVLATLNNPDVVLGSAMPAYGPYVKAVYNESGQVQSGTHGPRGSNSGASVLIIGNEASVTKSVDQQDDGAAKVSYDLAVGQRRVDYVISPKVVLSGGRSGTGAVPVDVTITDTLPKGVSVNTATKYFLGGTYTADSSPYGGSLSGGTEIEPAEGYPLANSNGTTTIRWIIKDVVPGEPMEKIHFSAAIGTPGDDEHDVANGQQLVNTVNIRAGGDNRNLSMAFGNIAENTIRIIKLQQSALVKMVATPLVEAGEAIAFNISHNNMGSTAFTDYRMLDVLPLDQDTRGSSFDGSYTGEVTLDLSENPGSKTTLGIYASSTDCSSETANTVNAADFQLVGTLTSGNVETLSLPADTKAVLLMGTLDAKDSYQLTITLLPTNNRGGNVYANDSTAAISATDYVLAPTVTAVTVQRTILGVAWLDSNEDGIRTADEVLLDGVKVRLLDLATGLDAKDVRGNAVAAVITDSDGSYRFEELAAGDYIVRFEGMAGFEIENYKVTAKNQGTNNKINSKADEVNAAGTLVAGEIKPISLPDKARVSPYGYMANYNDIGFTAGPAEVTLSGRKVLSGDRTTASIAAGQFSFTVSESDANDKDGYYGIPTAAVEVGSGGDITFGELTFAKEGTYEFTITENNGGVGGYTYDDKPVTVTVVVHYDRAADGLAAAVTYAKDGKTENGITFTNIYELEKTDIELTGVKELSGRVLEEGEFSFEVKEADKVVATAKNHADGTITFSKMEYTQPGEHTYTVSEVSGSKTGVTYDANTFTVTVAVVDDGAGKLIATTSYDEPVVFKNEFVAAPATVVLEGNKELTGDKVTADIKKGQFKFEITEAKENDQEAYTGCQTEAVGVAAGGTISFGTMVFYKAGSYEFTISEVDEKLSGYTYDDKAVTVKILVHYDESSYRLKAAVTFEKDGQKATEIRFTNIFKAETPDDQGYTVVKSVDKTSVKGSELLTYTLKVINSGETEYANIVVRDYIPQYTSYVSATNNGMYRENKERGYVTWYVKALGAKETITLSFVVKVDDCVPNNHIIENTAMWETLKGTYNPDDPKDPKHRTNSVGTTYVEKAVTSVKPRIGKWVKTGDESKVGLVTFVMLLSAAAGTALLIRRKRLKKV